MSSYRRPKHHTYDYNYKVGESSYRDMLDYLDKKESHRTVSPPPVQKSFAERFAERPIYGDPGPLKLYQSDLPARTTERPSDRWTSEPAERVAASPRPQRRPRAKLDDEPLAPRKSRAAPDEDALEMDPEELIASIRRGRAKRLELLNSLEDDAAEEEAAQSSSRRRRQLKLPSEEPEEAPVGRLRQLRLTGDEEEGSSSRALASSSSSYSASSKRSASSKMQSSSSTTSRSVHYE